jgi:hypothetical protein
MTDIKQITSRCVIDASGAGRILDAAAASGRTRG